MRIGFLSPFPPTKTGISDYSFNLIKSVESVCVNQTLYVIAPLLDDEADISIVGKKTILIRTWSMKSLGSTLKSIIAIIKTILAVKFDVLHIQYSFTREQGGSAGEPFFLIMLVAKKMLTNLSIVVSLHDFWEPVEAERRAYEIIGSTVLAKFYKLYYESYMRLMLSVPDLIIAIVNAKGSRVTDRIRKFTRNDVVEVLHGFPDVEQKHELSDAGIEKAGRNNRFTILLFGFVRKTKGYEYVIRAVQRIVESDPAMKEKIRLIIAGAPILPEDQDYLDHLKRLVRNMGLEDVVVPITRYLKKEEVDNLFRQADVAIHSYTRRVGPSGVFSFAVAYEVPSIITCDDKYITSKTDLPATIVSLNEIEIASAIRRLLDDKDEYEKEIRRIRQYKGSNNNRTIALSHVKLYSRLRHCNVD